MKLSLGIIAFAGLGRMQLTWFVEFDLVQGREFVDWFRKHIAREVQDDRKAADNTLESK